MRRRPPRSNRTDTLFPTRRSSDLPDAQEMEADGEPEMGGEGDEGMLPVRPNRLPSDIPDFNYLRFTEKHDEIILATELCDADELTRLRAYLHQPMAHMQGAVTKPANRLQRRLMAQQNRAWDFDPEEGKTDEPRTNGGEKGRERGR